MTATCRWTTSPTWPSRTRTDRARATDQDCDEGAPQGPFFHAAGERPATPIFRLHGSGAAHIRPPTRAADDASRTSGGAIAQLVERLNGIQEVRGSIPLGSTIRLSLTFQTAEPTRKAGLSRRRSRSLAASGAALSPAGERPGATASCATGRGGPDGHSPRPACSGAASHSARR